MSIACMVCACHVCGSSTSTPHAIAFSTLTESEVCFMLFTIPYSCRWLYMDAFCARNLAFIFTYVFVCCVCVCASTRACVMIECINLPLVLMYVLRLRRSPAWLLCLNQQYHMMGHNTLGMLMSHHVTSVLVCVQRVSVDELTVCHALIGWL